jgi:4-hydroxyacetophenone monooxygenase
MTMADQGVSQRQEGRQTHWVPPHDHAALRAAMAAANVNTLLMVYVHLTRDEAFLDQVAPFVRHPYVGPTEIPAELEQALHARLFTALTADAALPALPLPRALMQKMMSIGVGEPVADEFVSLMMEQAGFEQPVARRDAPSRPKPPAGFKVAVIGAGMIGITAAIKLEEAGYEFEVFEKNHEVGGTWFENVYPGVGVDTPSHFYSLSFAQSPDWDHYYPRGRDMQTYLVGVADRFDLRRHIRFNTRAHSLIYNEAERLWNVTVEAADGSRRTVQANAVINAHGPVNRWSLPEIPGLVDFKGPAMHTAGWDPAIDLKGKSVAVVGTGASGAQVVTALAAEVEKLTIFQRSKHWVMKNLEYENDVSGGVKWALRHIPYYMSWFRFRVFWFASDGLYPWVVVDPDWQDNELSISAANEGIRQYCLAGLQGAFGHRPDILEKMTPAFPVFSKRIVLDNGYFDALCRDNVDIETNGIEQITAAGIVTRDGRLVPVDAIIFATGFSIAKMVGNLTIIGRNGRNLGEEWGAEDPRAYLGTTMEGFPNLFWTVGPNSLPNHAGGNNLIGEGHVHYIIECLDMAIRNGATTVEPTKEAFDAYNARVDQDMRGMVWSHKNARSYFRNSKGRVFLSCPYRLVDMWTKLRAPNPEHYTLC